MKLSEISDQTLISYLTKVDADARKHPADPTKRSAEKRNKSVAGFSRAFNKLDARKDTPVKEDEPKSPPMKMQDYLDRAEELHSQMMAASARRDEEEYERIKRQRAELDAQGRRGMVPESTEEEKQAYEQAARDVVKGADPDHIARVRRLDPETLRKHVGYAWEKVNSGEYKLNRPNLEEHDDYVPPEKEVDYDDDYQDMVSRVGKLAKKQEAERGPVDLARLSQRLRDIDAGR